MLIPILIRTLSFTLLKAKVQTSTYDRVETTYSQVTKYTRYKI